MFDPLDREHWGLVWGSTLPVALIALGGLVAAPLFHRRSAQVIALVPLLIAAGVWFITWRYYPGSVPRVAQVSPAGHSRLSFRGVEHGYGGVWFDPVQIGEDGYRPDEIVADVIELPSGVVHRIPASWLATKFRVDVDKDEKGQTRPDHLRPHGLVVVLHGPTNPGAGARRLRFTVVGGSRYWHDCREVRGYALALWGLFWIAASAIALLIVICGWLQNRKVARRASRIIGADGSPG